MTVKTVASLQQALTVCVYVSVCLSLSIFLSVANANKTVQNMSLFIDLGKNGDVKADKNAAS